MSATARGFLLGVVTALGLAALGAVAFVHAGAYPIGADVPHAPMTLRLIDTLRDASTERAAQSVTVPRDLDDRAVIAQGAHEYAEECTGCHLAPGMTTSELRAGLYPQPPNLAQDGIDNDAEAFWIIKHGIKMSAMPAWGRTHDDRTLWSLVAFVRQMPKLTPAQYHALVASRAPADHDGS
ncbi:cytochrome c [Lysobacter sp. TY2-98]|uniref:c-type cytochrome n=1 Tax=Lysobacter sp. TY2-98 TaxID=2290922 RepID=UPI000E20B3BB|nr:cytochrome c [Lysobacter sp. TY2-98]AXK72824.1 cytochrome c [Lysobacter sp. TY2-98]